LGASKSALLVSVILIVCATIGIVVALRSFGAIQIGYNVVPSTQAPTLDPNPIQVSLGESIRKAEAVPPTPTAPPPITPA